ncbi:MAG: type II secretion system minor pseudopilin GspK [Piscirickettsiaceae bacterium]|nr:type II secretion system minor pseudopilin GspK [Piscirickettsiaceae bacterium]
MNNTSNYILTKYFSNKQKGVALVIVLLVVALVSVIATDLTGQLQRETRRSANLFDHQQARYYVLGAEKFAIAILQNNIKESPDRDDLNQAWATQGLYFPVEGGDLTGAITDKNRCFNLNSLISKSDDNSYKSNLDGIAFQAYKRLLVLLDLPDSLAATLIDWLDTDEQISSYGGAEDLEYELLSPAYRAANNLIVDVSELRLVQGYNNEVLTKLRPYVCALPEDGYFKLNVNTLDKDKPELLAMLIDKMSISIAETVLAERVQSGYDDLSSFWQLDALAGIEIDSSVKSVIQLDSDYYMLHARAQIGRGHKELRTLFKQVNKEKVQIIWRRFGTIQ